MSNSQKDFLATAKLCSKHAVEMCLSFKPGEAAAKKKLDKTWVTEADEKIEAELRKIIMQRHPEHNILGEEEGGNFSGDEESYTWILDPIDGTFSFVHGIPFYSSLVALVKGKKPIVGVAALPAMGIEMSASLGEGTFINGKRFEKSTLVGGSHVEIVATADPYRFRMEQKQKAFEELYLKNIKARTYPDALGYYMLLQGSVRAFVDPKVEIWDVAPFHVILPEAGFAIETWAGAKNLQRGTSVAYPINAQNKPENCEEVLQMLRNSL